MKFKAHALMRSHPEFTVDAKVAPVGFESSLSGSVEGAISSISAAIDEFPVRLAIPFMRRRSVLPMVAAVGGVKFKLKPFSVKVGAESFQLKGIVGTGGLEGKMVCQVACNTEMDMNGRVGGKVGSLVLQLGDDDDFDE